MMDDITFTSQILRRAREKIDNPDHWIKGLEARTASGDICDPWDKQAFCYCSIGAVRAAFVDIQRFVDRAMTTMPQRMVFEILANQIDPSRDKWSTAPVTCTITAFNDGLSTKHYEVLAVFDRAIEEAEKMEKKA